LLTTPKGHAGCLKSNSRLTVTPPYGTSLIGGIFGFAWFILVFGPSILNPTYLGWVMQGDGAQHVLGWLFFRHEPWSWPLGSVSSFPHPVGTTVGYTDSIPWLAIAAKVISPFLPADFQYVGPWLGLCFFLQGWFGVRIVQELSPDPLMQILAGACFILDPVLLWRIGHDSLCAHWLVLGLIWLHLRSWPEGRAPRRVLAITLGFCVISAGVHPYLATMVLALALALVCKVRWVDHSLSTRQMTVWGGVYAAATVGVFAALGYIGSGISWGANGFGEYSADLLTLVNPAGTSRLLPALPIAPGQYEGFGYVGSDVLVLSVIGLAIIWYNPDVLGNRSLKPWVPLGICAALLAVFALSSRVTLAGKPILTLGHFYRPFMDIIAPFRTSGRFIWPLHYVYITAIVAIWIIFYQSSKFLVYTAFLGIIAIQIFDFKDPFLRWYYDYHQRKQPFMLQISDWQHASGLYKHMVLYPPQILGGTLPGCIMPGFEQDFYVPLAYQAYRLNVTFNSGYFARVDDNKARKYCQKLHEQIQAGQFADDTIYVVHHQYWDLVSPHIPQISCGRLSDYIACVSAPRNDAFRDFLEHHRLE
jgi:Family of unknown function (DUF6311)